MNIREVRNNIAALKLFSFLDSLYPMSILAVVWFYTITGSYALAAMMFSISMISKGIFEIPSGMISDKLKRVINIRASAGLWFLSYFLTAASSVFGGTAMLVFASVIGGLAFALYSGTMEALIYETLADARKQDKFDIVFSRFNMIGQIGAMCGAGIAASIMFFADLYALAWLTAFVGALFFVSSFLLAEPATRIKSGAAPIKYFWVSLRRIWRNKKLRTLIGIKMLGGDATYLMEGAYFAMLIPAPLIPFARLFRQFTGAIGFYLAPFIRKLGFLRILLFSNIGSMLFFAFGLGINGKASPFVMSSTNLFYGFNMTATQSLMQKEFSPQQRATMGNIQSLLIGTAGGIQLIFLGLIADAWGLRFALASTLILDVIMTAGYWRLFKKYKS